jgi:uncharacterized membrane protein YqjE
MDELPDNPPQLAAISKKVARQLLTIGENRLELFTLEVQEERERFLRAVHLSLGIAVFGLLAAITLTGAIVVGLRAYSPGLVLLILAVLYGGAALCLMQRLAVLRRDWQTLSSSLEQFRKDRLCLEKILQ